MVKIRKNRQPRQWSKQTHTRSGSTIIIGKLREGRPGVTTKKRGKKDGHSKNSYGQKDGLANSFEVVPVTLSHRIWQTRRKIEENAKQIKEIIRKRGSAKGSEAVELQERQTRRERTIAYLHDRIIKLSAENTRLEQKTKEIKAEAVRVKAVKDAQFDAMIREQGKTMPKTERSKRFRPEFKSATDKKMEKQAIIHVGKSSKVITKRQKRWDLK